MELKRKEYGQSPWLLFVMFKMFWQHHVQQGVLTFIEVQLIIIIITDTFYAKSLYIYIGQLLHHYV